MTPPPSPEQPVTDADAEAWTNPAETNRRVVRLLADRARDKEQAELDRTEIQAYSELLDEVAKTTGAENYVEAVVLATRAQERIGKLEKRNRELEKGMKNIAGAKHLDGSATGKIIRKKARALLGEVPDVK